MVEPWRGAGNRRLKSHCAPETCRVSTRAVDRCAKNHGLRYREGGILSREEMRVGQALEHAPQFSSGAIIAVWLILALTRAGRRPANWFELLSLIFGSLCIVWFFVRYWVSYADLPWLSGDPITW